MKTINLKAAYQILEDASAVILDDNILLYPSLADLEGQDDNEFLYLGWTEDGNDYSIKFKEANNKEVVVSGSSLFLTDDEGDQAQITILSPKHLETSEI